MKAFMHEFNKAARQGSRLYFAPLIGAINAVKTELKKPPEAPAPRKPRSQGQDTRPAPLR